MSLHRSGIPEGLRVLPDGSWRAGEEGVTHPATLLYLKAHLVFDEEGAWVTDGRDRVRVTLEGPPLVVLSLTIDPLRGEARVQLDDGSEELLHDGSLAMHEPSGRFEYTARGGLARAAFSRSAHQTLLDHVEQLEGGEFVLRAGRRGIALRA
jgi:hypothetical protein